ncbi:hypothetical protein DENSPDRAFT_846015 [Dentipellis sp. KUC8613]|nr:hypothetical protein DENSPDRAFT_846015 [Dentipellis sp. KUC8613]
MALKRFLLCHLRPVYMVHHRRAVALSDMRVPPCRFLSASSHIKCQQVSLAPRNSHVDGPRCTIMFVACCPAPNGDHIAPFLASSCVLMEFSHQ